MYILATHIYIVKEKVSLAADGQFIPPPKRWGTSCPFRLKQYTTEECRQRRGKSYHDKGHIAVSKNNTDSRTNKSGSHIACTVEDSRDSHSTKHSIGNIVHKTFDEYGIDFFTEKGKRYHSHEVGNASHNDNIENYTHDYFSVLDRYVDFCFGKNQVQQNFLTKILFGFLGVKGLPPFKILLRGCRPLTPPTFLKKSGQKTFNTAKP